MGTPAAKDKYFYEFLAEKLSTNPEDEENPMDRGARLEEEAIGAFETITGNIVERVGFAVSDDNGAISNSPDGLILNKGKYTEAIEIKCLGSANHLRAILENEIPKEYYPQCVQYFIVNDDLQTLHFVLYDPRITVKPIHIIELHREDILDDIAKYKDEQLKFLAKVEEKLTEIIKI